MNIHIFALAPCRSVVVLILNINERNSYKNLLGLKISFRFRNAKGSYQCCLKQREQIFGRSIVSALILLKRVRRTCFSSRAASEHVEELHSGAATIAPCLSCWPHTPGQRPLTLRRLQCSVLPRCTVHRLQCRRDGRAVSSEGAGGRSMVSALILLKISHWPSTYITENDGRTTASGSIQPRQSYKTTDVLLR